MAYLLCGQGIDIDPRRTVPSDYINLLALRVEFVSVGTLDCGAVFVRRAPVCTVFVAADTAVAVASPNLLSPPVDSQRRAKNSIGRRERPTQHIQSLSNHGDAQQQQHQQQPQLRQSMVDVKGCARVHDATGLLQRAVGKHAVAVVRPDRIVFSATCASELPLVITALFRALGTRL